MTPKDHLARLALELYIRDPSLLEGDSELLSLAERAASRDLVRKPIQRHLPWMRRAPGNPSWAFLKTKELENRMVARCETKS